MESHDTENFIHPGEICRGISRYLPHDQYDCLCPKSSQNDTKEREKMHKWETLSLFLGEVSGNLTICLMSAGVTKQQKHFVCLTARHCIMKQQNFA